MHLTDHKLELFKYKLSNGKVDYFYAFGKSIRKHLMRTPVHGARLSSKFGVENIQFLVVKCIEGRLAAKSASCYGDSDGRVCLLGETDLWKIW